MKRQKRSCAIISQGGSKMQDQTVHIVSQAIRYIEEHLHEKIDLDMAASALHYSKYHLHRVFMKAVGMTIHGYAKRRQLTEAAKLLVCSEKPIIEIALMSGYGSQQAFAEIFKAMYKISPAKFREMGNFYPLQLEIHLQEEPVKMDLTKDDIEFATPADADDWMELVSLAIDGYPCLNKDDYVANLYQYIAGKKALILRERAVSAKPNRNAAVGVMGFSPDTGSIDFLAVHPQYRHCGITKLFLDKLADELLCGREITLTTYRAGDRADTGWREEYRRLGFAERELLVEYGYPAQRFVFLPEGAGDRSINKEDAGNGRNTEKSISGEF